MELKYRTVPQHEGGAALPNCGTIHISEVRPTLSQLSAQLNYAGDLNNCTVGSTGKKEFSGDIDLVIESSWWDQPPAMFKLKLSELFGKDNVAQNGGMVHLRYPIVRYQPGHTKRLPRTGFVQIDFNFGDLAWEKFYHYSPGSDSEYKGAHRNLAIAAITAATGVDHSPERDSYNRPINQIRWKWSPTGFVKVQRQSQVDQRSGVWMRRQDDTVIEGPYFDGEKIARIIFPEDGKLEDLSSLETLILAVKRNYGMVDQARIWRRMADNFRDWRDGKNFVYPIEIDQYFMQDDK